MEEDDINKYMISYGNNLYDIKGFLLKHPGGVNTLKGLNNKDITNRFLKAPPHSDAAMYLMQEYKINKLNGNKIKSINNNNNNNNYNYNNKNISQLINTDNNEDNIINNNNQLKNDIDESLEYLVDWSKPMLSQISKIEDKYDEWVHKPVDRELRLFESPYLEMLTKTPWWVVFGFWVPNIMFLVYAESLKLLFTTLISNFIFGIILWSFIEYSLHRWVFHMKTNSRNKYLCTFHFLLHGLHHKVPYDSKRLVFPPVPAVALATIFYLPISLLFTNPRIILAGGLFGYLCYDMMHYYLHYGNPSIQHLYNMKRYHFQHHFSHQDQGFGISSPLWDFVFSTRIYLRKLNFKLNWSY